MRDPRCSFDQMLIYVILIYVKEEGVKIMSSRSSCLSSVILGTRVGCAIGSPLIDSGSAKS